MPQMYTLYYIIVNSFLLIVVLKESSSTGKVILTKIKGFYRVGPHSSDILSIIFGSLLGDGHAEKRIGGIGTRITFQQEDSHGKYGLYLHSLLANAGYCNENIPQLQTRLGNKGKVRKVIRFRTWTYTSFNWIWNDWYKDGVKRVPSTIGNYLTPLALAIWIMDDGAKVGKGLKLCSNSFTQNECILLANTLQTKFNLKVTVQLAGSKNKDQYILYIWKESMPTLVEIVKPFIISEMKYKIL